MGETRVDLQHLLEDLRDAYTGALEETILTEVLANALDSGATHVALRPHPADATLTIVDNGRGMRRRELARYHDVAASTKTRGEGIGFAGVGIKLGLLVSREVITETRRGATHVATRWHLASRYRAPWKWSPPPGLTGPRGTAVQLCLVNPLSPLVDAGYLEETIRRHFEPLFDPAFDDVLRRHYPEGVTFEIEAPDLSACLTLSKNDFVRTGPRGAAYLTCRKAVQEVVSRQLAEWGDAREADARPRLVRLERDLERVLEGLADDFPLLRSLVDRRAGGQKRLPMPGRGGERVAASLFTTAAGEPTEDAATDHGRSDDEGPVITSGNTPLAERDVSGHPRPDLPRPDDSDAPEARSQAGDEPAADSPVAITSATALDTVSGRRRPARYGLLVQFESRPDDAAVAHLVHSTIWINDAHPAYRRAAASRSLGYHTALAVALALAPLAVEAASEHAFLTQFLAHWGAASSPRVSGRRTPGNTPAGG